MSLREFSGHGGLSLAAEVYGQEDHPCVLMLPGGTQTREVWAKAAQDLSRAGRYVVVMDLRGHGKSGWARDGRYALDDFVADLGAVLSQLSSRPVIVGSTLGGWIALVALGEAAVPLATGLVLSNPPARLSREGAIRLSETLRRQIDCSDHAKEFDPSLVENGIDFHDLEARLHSAAAGIKMPTLIVRGTDSELTSSELTQSLAERIPGAETLAIDGGGYYVAFDDSERFNALLLDFLERHVPRKAPEYVSGSDSRTLRDAMGCFATGVTVVTTVDHEGRPVGLTANSFTSVSLEPPLLLVCLGNHLASLPVFRGANSFAANVLHIGQQSVSNLFAAKVGDRFREVEWETWEHGVPIINNSLASFECVKRAEIEQGDHLIYVGEVVRARFEPR